MEKEIENCVAQILSLFPDDYEVKNINRKLDERAVDRTIERSRKTQGRPLPKEPKETWPQLTATLKMARSGFDLSQAYMLSIGLHQMGLNLDALELVRSKRAQWGTREKLWELELLIAQDYFAEALAIAQILMLQHKDEADSLRAILYYSAKAYHGLEDTEQASSILKSILKYEPGYRDASILLVEWEGSDL